MLIPPDKKDTPATPSQPGMPSQHPSSSSSTYQGVNRVSESSPLLPPSYVESQQSSSQPHHHSYTDRHSPPASSTSNSGAKRRNGASPCKRFTKAFCAAIGLLLLASLIAGLIGAFGQWASGRIERGRHGGDGDGGDGNGGGEVSDGDLPWKDSRRHGGWNNTWSSRVSLDELETSPFNCDVFPPPHLLPPLSTYPSSSLMYTTSTTFYLPASTVHHTTFLHARGYWLTGRVIVKDADELLARDGHDGDEKVKEGMVRVDVEARWDGRDGGKGWRGVHVCQSGEGEGDSGVFIHNEFPSSILRSFPWRTRPLEFIVTIYLPATASSIEHPLDMQRLEIKTENMKTWFEGEKFKDVVEFREVMVRGSNGAVEVDSLTAQNVDFKTTNAGIKLGQMNVDQLNTLQSTNGAISCTSCCITSPKDRARSYTITTTNAGVTGKFCAKEKISIVTSNGNIDGQFNAPTLEARTSNAKISGEWIGVRGSQQGGSGLKLTTSDGSVDVRVDVGAKGNSSSMTSSEISEFSPSTTPKKPSAPKITETIFVDIRTTNAAINYNLVDVPLTVKLMQTLKTTNGKLNVNGHANFQGDFTFSTSSYSKVVLSTVPGSANRNLVVTNGRSSPWYLSAVGIFDGRYEGNGFVQGYVARSGESKDDKDVVWGQILGDTSNSNVDASL